MFPAICTYTYSRILLCLSIMLSCLLPVAQAEEDSVIWESLRNGKGIALIRHALAPGGGDPASFVLYDCSTQRNLAAEGRTQASYIGQLFKQHKIMEARLHSSQWCRCLDTAALMEMTEVMPNPLLNSFFANREDGPEQLAELRKWLQEQPVSTTPLVLVTHQVVITGLTGVYPSSGEIVVIRHPEAGETDISVLGTLETR